MVYGVIWVAYFQGHLGKFTVQRFLKILSKILFKNNIP